MRCGKHVNAQYLKIHIKSPFWCSVYISMFQTSIEVLKTGLVLNDNQQIQQKR
jgi:hypothetical protein